MSVKPPDPRCDAVIPSEATTFGRYTAWSDPGTRLSKDDKEFAKKVYGGFAHIDDPQLLEANWREYATHLLRVPRPTHRQTFSK